MRVSGVKWGGGLCAGQMAKQCAVAGQRSRPSPTCMALPSTVLSVDGSISSASDTSARRRGEPDVKAWTTACRPACLARTSAVAPRMCAHEREGPKLGRP